MGKRKNAVIDEVRKIIKRYSNDVIVKEYDDYIDYITEKIDTTINILGEYAINIMREVEHLLIELNTIEEYCQTNDLDTTQFNMDGIINTIHQKLITFQTIINRLTYILNNEKSTTDYSSLSDKKLENDAEKFVKNILDQIKAKEMSTKKRVIKNNTK